MTQEQQQQHRELLIREVLPNTYNNNNDEYIQAQRQAAEALMIGRETLQQVVQQGEQLNHAEYLADETEYKLDRATRLLRGMTWSGWVANLIQKDKSQAPTLRDNNNNNIQQQQQELPSTPSRIPPSVYENVPKTCATAAQAVQNYQCNLIVLESCETIDQQDTCREICNSMFQQATKQIGMLQHAISNAAANNDHTNHFGNNNNSTNRQKQQQQQQKYSIQEQKFLDLLKGDLQILRNRQFKLQSLTKQPSPNKKSPSTPSSTSAAAAAATASSPMNAQRMELFGTRVASNNDTNNNNNNNTDAAATPSPAKKQPPTALELQMQQQDAHLDNIAQHLSELNHVANNLNHSMAGQHTTLEALEDKSESMLFKSKMVTRRADRLIHKKAWIKPKAEFEKFVTIRLNLNTTKHSLYLSIASNGSVILSNRLTETCLFGLWKYKNKNDNSCTIFGLQSKYNNRWMGQNLIGNLVCTATQFGRREEWEAELDDKGDNWKSTAIICTSAGWGNGGYLLVHQESAAVHIGGNGLDDKKIAPKWDISAYTN